MEKEMISLDILLKEIWAKEPTIRIEHCAFSNEVIVATRDDSKKVTSQSFSDAIIKMWLQIYRKDTIHAER